MTKNTFKLFCLTSMAFFIVSCSGTHSYMPSFHSSTNTGTPRPSAVPVSDNAFWQGNPTTVWNRLQYLSVAELNAAHSNNPTENAWVNLALISKKDSGNTPQLINDLTAWRAQNPDHPGNALFPNNNALTNLLNAPQPQHLAVLLPLTGSLGRQGQTVRDGFLSSFYAAKTKQAISFYDTGENADVNAQYQKALSDGADFVIGPLTKDQVKNLMSSNIPVTTLALNYTDSNSLPRNFYQFGLSPQDEAIQLADKAYSAHLSRAIIIASQNDSGQKVVNTLSARFKSNGGSVQDVLYISDKSNLTQDVANLLHVTPPKEGMNTVATAADKKALQQNMQNQRRQDFDVVFLITSPQEARVVVPLLKFYYVNNAPIYATSSIFSGQRTAQRDMDLNGVIFCDTPWTLSGAARGARGSRLYAVGRDSYLLSANLTRLTVMPNFPIYGSTGALSLTADHQIFRRLPWTKIHNGEP